MDHITPNSSALEGLRPAKLPFPDGDFFMAFAPEAAFALVVGILAALAYWHFSRLFAKLDVPQAEPVKKKGPKESAMEEIAGLDAEDPEFAAKIWHSVRLMLSRKTQNAFLPNMTAEEAVQATKGLPGFENLALLARELEYAGHERDAETHEKLRTFAMAFIETT